MHDPSLLIILLIMFVLLQKSQQMFKEQMVVDNRGWSVIIKNNFSIHCTATFYNISNSKKTVSITESP